MYAISEPHILIQKFSSEIALNIEATFTGTYDTMMLDVLRNSGKSTMAVQKMDYNETVNSYWHATNEVDTDHDFHFAYDFDSYWFEPLSDVFGLPRKQIEDIAAHVILKEWQIKSKNGYNNDPRVSIWNRYSNERETWHDHGSYPRTDNFDFYLSYHSMMVAAAKLLEKMPVVSKRDWHENEWEEWLSEHLLTCTDGKWLADYRDPIPLKRPDWISKNRDDNWRTEISEKNFYDALLTDDNGEIWINIKGAWQESTSDRDERFSIASALVSKGASDALMRALETCSNPYDYKLPDYNESNMEIDSGSFVLKGWLNGESVSKRLDEYDPYADNIDYPPYVIGDDITAKLKLSVSVDGKIWYSPMSTLPTIKSKIWSSHRAGRDENPNQAGNQIKASLEFLTHLCTTLNCDLILKVGIEREISYKYRNQDEKYEYSKPINKIFILTSDGELRNIRQNYKLG